MAQGRKNRSRPSSLDTPEGIATVKKEIIDRLSEGEYIHVILGDGRADHLPSIGTHNKWIAEDEAYYEEYRKIQEARAHSILERCQGLTDDLLKAGTRIKVRRIDSAIKHLIHIAEKRNPRAFGHRTNLGNADGSKIPFGKALEDILDEE